MSTRASITLKTKEGKYRTIYLHHDGYPSYAGEILKKHYNTYEDVENLINLGDISTLGVNIVPSNRRYSFSAFQDVCVAYFRDRGEAWEYTKPREYDNLPIEMDKWVDSQEFNYFFIDGKWTMKKGGD